MSFKDLSFIPNTSSANSQKPCSLDIATCCICLNVLVSIPIPRSLRLKQRVVNFISASRLLSLRLMVALPTARTSMTYVEKDTRQAPERNNSMNSATEHPRNGIVDQEEPWPAIHIVHYYSVCNEQG